jgi:hypothetical protein
MRFFTVFIYIFVFTMRLVYHFCKVLEDFTKITNSLSITYIIIRFLPLPNNLFNFNHIDIFLNLKVIKV